jgi:CheY-like chemotaxis protein
VGIKILLADDSVTAQNMGKKILSEAGHEVVTVSNGAAAAKKIAEIKPELVLLDVFMPGYSGLELCEKLRNAAETAKMPVLLTVGRMEPYNAQDGARVKADGVIVKPFEASDLTAAVDRIAEKAKPVVKPVENSGPKMHIVYKGDAPEELDSPARSEEGRAAAKKSDDSDKPYDKTMRLDSKQIHAALNQTPATTEIVQVEDGDAPKSDSPFRNSQFESSAPAIPLSTFEEVVGGEATSATKESSDDSKAEQPPVASFMIEYLPEEEAQPHSANSGTQPHAGDSSEDASIHEQPTGAFPIHNDFKQSPSQNEIHGERRHQGGFAAAVPELELTAAAPVPNVPVANEPGLELTRQSAGSDTTINLDPALETDPHRATMDFPTRFGTQQPELANQLLEALQHPAGTSEPVVDEFEARLNEAMEAYEEPAAEPQSEASSANAHLSELGSRFEADPAPATDSFEAQVEAAMHDFDAPEAAAQPTATPAPEPELAREHVVENHSAEFEIAPAIESLDPVVEPEIIQSTSETSEDDLTIEEIAAPETDDSVIQQMREGLSHLPVEPPHIEISESIPMATNAAKDAVSSSTTPSLPKEAEAEIGRAMAAAVGAESTPIDSEPVNAASESAAKGDGTHLAGAVESVMKRELPNLIWKIMAELDLRKRG